MQEKLTVLKQIAKHLNDRNITWQLGGSTMLFLRQIVDHFDDIDVMIADENFQEVDHILKEIAAPISVVKHPIFSTKHFQSYICQGIKIDVMAGLTISKDGKKHSFHLMASEAFDSYVLEEVTIKLSKLETWLHYYELMDRYDKVSIIKDHIQSKS